jgi:hypothetical protein
MRTKFLLGLMIAAAFGFATMRSASADPIENGLYDFYSLNPAPKGSGLGNYNVILFENAPAGSENASQDLTVNVDDSNTLLPTGGNDVSSLSLFWMTSVADLRAFYEQQFSSPINNIVLFLDLNESGNAANSSITIDTLTIYQNATTNNGLIPIGNDLPSDQQQLITSQSGGTILRQLTSSQLLGQISTGQGIDDWSIFTYIDPYALPSNATLLFNLQLSQLNSGSEVLSISGTFSACDITPEGCGTTSSGTTSGGSTDGSSTTTTSGSTDGSSTTTTSGSTDGSSTTTTSGSTDGSSTTTTSGSTDGNPTSGNTDGSPTSGVTGDTSGTSGHQVPEPASFLLLGAGLVAVVRLTRKKRD